MYVQDTIAAIATPRGPGGIGIVRISGPLSELIADSLVSRRRTEKWQSHRMYHGRLLGCDGNAIDQVLAVLMRAPNSYTAEDVLELHCHGSPLVLHHAMEAVLKAGARPATAGEFTRRAFLNGKLDLVQVEGLADLMRAQSTEDARLAAERLFGQLSRYLNTIRDRLIVLKSRIELQIDFSDEDVEVGEAELLQDLRDTAGTVQNVLATHRQGRRVRQGIRVAIVGRPNVGKSSLLNALLGEERAIVTATAGTTRDVLEEAMEMEGIAVVLSDTAGLHDHAGEIERLGVERAQQVLRVSDLRLIVIDRSLPPDVSPEWFEADHTIAVLNKIDLPSAWKDHEISSLCNRCPVVEVSATQGTGLELLRKLVVEMVGAAPVDGLPTLSRTRQQDALSKAYECLTTAAASLETGTPLDLVAVDVQAALDHFGSLTGLVTPDDVLDQIFADFCIGK